MDPGLVYDDIISYWQTFLSNSTPEATYEGHKIEGNFEKLEHYALKRKDKKQGKSCTCTTLRVTRNWNSRKLVQIQLWMTAMIPVMKNFLLT